MAAKSIAVLDDRARRRTIGDAASMLVRTRYCTETIVPQYERYYQDVTQQKA
jgi:hypothetical protein